ncbi:alpha-1,4-glucan--maltose-1-phosphate maltosyltransferase [Variovorax sp. YR216]|uniref:alpha-1,4-glucan--maltose-1-phosphate maltosyltransferase n=1 Tax=Variovorax sp. YR216 TaxID=1882828 RepID=UPI0008979A80|nr:alpha-1,4-glucan--maltose-1-phosphate maltosyltransferase [Variovorax sp. YR216]SEA54061.1 alpha-1,4-glucan:maltose-1-phosphate maltosyltransferase [Variovorax sp. YR216]
MISKLLLRDDAPVPVDVVDGRSRAVVDAVLPIVDGGRFAVKRTVGESMRVTAHVFTDGHDVPRVMLQWWKDGDERSHEVPMKLRYNDEWHAEFTPPVIGRYHYTVVAWVDAFESWRHELVRRVDADDIRIAARTGAMEIAAAAERAKGDDRDTLAHWARSLEEGANDGAMDVAALKALALDDDFAALASRHPDRHLESRFAAELPLVVDRERARFSTWYELFPRSASSTPGAHGTFRDVEERLPLIASMGFDVLYMPPVHPIGRVQRKGRNNTLTPEPGDVGSPWAIGATEGGHKALLPALGTPEDFRHLVAAASRLGIDIAMDIAFQCAPDHPYVKEHPTWFRWRPDGTVQYAENPPKKYQDIYPFHFESGDWEGLWSELKSVFDHWIGEGVTVFRVDNPHTKSFAFWEWVITEVKRVHPEAIFLAEAFTRPKVMQRLAKLGYTQSYTYFTWRNSKEELTEYFTELNKAPGKEYFRPNVWPNTPDILHAALQTGEEPVFRARLVLAATLAANYGMYGPAFELLEHLPRGPSSEEYLDSEKYQLRHWDWSADAGLRPFITRINQIRRANDALQFDHSLRFLDIDNDHLIAYIKTSPDESRAVVTVVNLDPHHTQIGWLHLDPDLIGVPRERSFQMHDLLTDQRFVWHGTHHYIELDPHRMPAHVMAVRRRLRDERDFDYYA